MNLEVKNLKKEKDRRTLKKDGYTSRRTVAYHLVGISAFKVPQNRFQHLDFDGSL